MPWIQDIAIYLWLCVFTCSSPTGKYARRSSQYVWSRYQSNSIFKIYFMHMTREKSTNLSPTELRSLLWPVNFQPKNKIGRPNDFLPWSKKCWRSMFLRWWRNLGHQSGMLLMVTQGGQRTWHHECHVLNKKQLAMAHGWLLWSIFCESFTIVNHYAFPYHPSPILWKPRTCYGAKPACRSLTPGPPNL